MNGIILYPTDDEISEFIYANYVLTCKRQVENKPVIFTETIDKVIRRLDIKRSKNETVLG